VVRFKGLCCFEGLRKVLQPAALHGKGLISGLLFNNACTDCCPSVTKENLYFWLYL
jgi:hypothetical protein